MRFGAWWDHKLIFSARHCANGIYENIPQPTHQTKCSGTHQTICYFNSVSLDFGGNVRLKAYKTSVHVKHCEQNSELKGPMK